MMRFLTMALVIFVLLAFGSTAQATLINNGNNLIYDTDLNITWYNPSLTNMGWIQAMSWAENLTMGSAIDWRLPTAFNSDGAYPLYGYNVVSSELGHLYYVELGNSAYGPLTNTGPFSNLQSVNYWTSSTTTKFAGNAFAFSFITGEQGHADKSLIIYYSALAVHSGDIHASAQTPIPGAILLFGPGLVGIIAIRRKFMRKSS